MRDFERRRCTRCQTVMRIVDGSQRTGRDKIFFKDEIEEA